MPSKRHKVILLNYLDVLLRYKNFRELSYRYV